MYKNMAKILDLKKIKSWNLEQFISKFHKSMKFRNPNKRLCFVVKKYDKNNVKYVYNFFLLYLYNKTMFVPLIPTYFELK